MPRRRAASPVVARRFFLPGAPVPALKATIARGSPVPAAGTWHEGGGGWPTMTDGDDKICSAKGCRNPAAYALSWNNPKIHAPERHKIWLACAEHKDSLADFLDRRSFLKEISPL